MAAFQHVMDPCAESLMTSKDWMLFSKQWKFIECEAGQICLNVLLAMAVKSDYNAAF